MASGGDIQHFPALNRIDERQDNRHGTVAYLGGGGGGGGAKGAVAPSGTFWGAALLAIDVAFFPFTVSIKIHRLYTVSHCLWF